MNPPSIFDVHDGDVVWDAYAVPGTPVVVRVQRFIGWDFWCEDQNGTTIEPLSSELMTEFRERQVNASIAHQIGHRIRARFL